MKQKIKHLRPVVASLAFFISGSIANADTFTVQHPIFGLDSRTGGESTPVTGTSLTHHFDFSQGTSTTIIDQVTGNSYSARSNSLVNADDGQQALDPYVGTNINLALTSTNWAAEMTMAPPYLTPATGSWGGIAYILTQTSPKRQRLGLYRDGGSTDGYVYEAKGQRTVTEVYEGSPRNYTNPTTMWRFQKVVAEPVQRMRWIKQDNVIRVYINDNEIASALATVDDQLADSYKLFEGDYANASFRVRSFKLWTE